jgi:hypothetical protein
MKRATIQGEPVEIINGVPQDPLYEVTDGTHWDACYSLVELRHLCSLYDNAGVAYTVTHHPTIHTTITTDEYGFSWET